MKLREFLNEASHPRRAWNNKLDNIGKLLSWMYEKDILSSADKKKKDSLFNAYRRYYNDGDFPRILSKQGLSKYQNPQRIEEALEAAIDEFLKQMLTKYLPKVDRTVYRMDQTLKTIDQLTRIANDVDPYALEVFSKDLKLEDDSLLVMFLDKLFEESKDLNEELDKVSPNTQGYSTKYRIAYMKEDPMQYGKITPEITTKWESITKLCKKIAMLLGYMKETVEKVRDQRLLEK